MVDGSVKGLTQLLYDLFASKHLVRTRTFAKDETSQPKTTRAHAPPHLRNLRRIAERAQKWYRNLLKTGADANEIRNAKTEWNKANAERKKVAHACKNKFCTNWSELWQYF